MKYKHNLMNWGRHLTTLMTLFAFVLGLLSFTIEDVNLFDAFKGDQATLSQSKHASSDFHGSESKKLPSEEEDVEEDAEKRENTEDSDLDFNLFNLGKAGKFDFTHLESDNYKDYLRAYRQCISASSRALYYLLYQSWEIYHIA